MAQYRKLRLLLEKEVFPHLFTFKFIGNNTPRFEEGVRSFELKCPELVQQSRRQSKNQNHISLTYTLNAETAESIIEIFRAIAEIPDVRMIL